MSEPKHTPGPWRWDGKYCGDIVDADGYSVAGIMELEEVAETDSNARLIAAAPDLLAACVEFVRKVEDGDARSTRSYAQMKAAIAKVVGDV